MQAHTLGEVGNLGTVSLRVSSGTILPVFIEIGSYLTDKEQKISWHSFFETRCIMRRRSDIALYAYYKIIVIVITIITVAVIATTVVLIIMNTTITTILFAVCNNTMFLLKLT